LETRAKRLRKGQGNGFLEKRVLKGRREKSKWARRGNEVAEGAM